MKFNMGPLGPQIMAQVDTNTTELKPKEKMAVNVDGSTHHKTKGKGEP